MVIKGKRYKTTLRAAPLPIKMVVLIFTCDPSINNEHMFIGFLSKVIIQMIYVCLVVLKKTN